MPGSVEKVQRDAWPVSVRQLLAAASLFLFCFSAVAQQFNPYPQPHVTRHQWQTYFDEVRAKHASGRQEFPVDNLVIFEDNASHTSYAFTTPAHPAHPAWITRQASEDARGVRIRQIGYFAGDEAPFAKLFKQFEELNAKIRDELMRGKPRN